MIDDRPGFERREVEPLGYAPAPANNDDTGFAEVPARIIAAI